MSICPRIPIRYTMLPVETKPRLALTLNFTLLNRLRTRIITCRRWTLQTNHQSWQPTAVSRLSAKPSQDNARWIMKESGHDMTSKAGKYYVSEGHRNSTLRYRKDLKTKTSNVSSEKKNRQKENRQKGWHPVMPGRGWSDRYWRWSYGVEHVGWAEPSFPDLDEKFFQRTAATFSVWPEFAGERLRSGTLAPR